MRAAMKLTAIGLLLCSLPALAADKQELGCLIIKHATAAHQVFVSGANWQYVDGEFPPGEKWKSNITDRYIRKIKGKDWRVVIIPTNYTMADLEQARASCREGRK